MAFSSTSEYVSYRLQEQAGVMASIVQLINSKICWNDWTSEDKFTLVGALLPVDGNRYEEIKAETLKWHLFRANLPKLNRPNLEREDLSERVRADVQGLVKLGSGRYFFVNC